jgi:phosphotransferase system HPr-like phosphotransfer protein
MRYSLFPASGAAHKKMVSSHFGRMSQHTANKIAKILNLGIIKNKTIYIYVESNDECL